jgi:hypothetical protein
MAEKKRKPDFIYTPETGIDINFENKELVDALTPKLTEQQAKDLEDCCTSVFIFDRSVFSEGPEGVFIKKL